MSTDTELYFGQTDPATGQGGWNELRFIIQQQMLGLNVSMPVKVLSVQPGGLGPVGFVSIQILVDQVTGNDKTVPHGEITNVPYVRMQGGTNAVIIDPEVGDIGIACFASRDISAVKNVRAEAPPGSRRAYDFSDAMYIGGLLNGVPTRYIQFTDSGIIVHAPDSVTTQSPVISIDGNTVDIQAMVSAAITSALINLAGQVNMGDVGGALKALMNEAAVAIYNNHTHGGGPIPTQQMGPSVLTVDVKAT